MSASVKNVSIRFGATQALRDVSLGLKDRELHALLGANGSGKSTLSKVLAGAYQPDSGSVTIGKTTSRGISSPRAAAELGVRIVHQDSPMINSLSVGEAFAMAKGYGRRGQLSPVPWRQLRAAAAETLERFSVPVSPSTLAGDLSASLRAMVSVALALDGTGDEAELLILDEVTASIPESQAGEFLERVRRLPEELDMPVLMITHRFKEVSAYADSATVLAQGSVVYDGSASEISAAQLVRYMTQIPQADDRGTLEAAAAAHHSTGPMTTGLDLLSDRSQDGATVLAVEGLVAETLVDISFEVQTGEMVGIAGLPESGVTELPFILAGGAGRTAGRIKVNGTELPASGRPSIAQAAGVALVPADRLREGGIASLPVAENMTLPQASKFWHRRRAEAATVAKMQEAFDVHPRDARVLFGGLSGGNQQKVIIAKWLLTDPKVLILDDPTVGVDPAARVQLFNVLTECTTRGLAVVVLSSEPEVLATYCSRVLVLGAGRVVAELTGDQLQPSSISADVITLSSQA